MYKVNARIGLSMSNKEGNYSPKGKIASSHIPFQCWCHSYKFTGQCTLHPMGVYSCQPTNVLLLTP